MVKEKIGQARTYDGDGFRQRAACICFKDRTEEEILLISSSRFTNHWVIPGGGIEPMEDPGVAATREVWEEAGVKGQIIRFLGVFQNNERKHRTAVFELIVEELAEDWEESRMLGRRRKWFPVEEADVLLSHHKPVQRSYLKLFTTLKKKRLLLFHLPLSQESNSDVIAVASTSENQPEDCEQQVEESTEEQPIRSNSEFLTIPISPDLSNYIPETIRQNGRLYTMAKNTFYAYAPDDCKNVSWPEIAQVVASVYTEEVVPNRVAPENDMEIPFCATLPLNPEENDSKSNNDEKDEKRLA